MSDKTLQFGPYTVEASSLDKILFPDDGITKADLIDYYRRIADTMLPLMEDRPLNMQRFPDGIDQSGFYEKKVPDYFPAWITRTAVTVQETGETQEQVVCDKTATLVYLANQACITPHLWLSPARNLHRPDRLIFDLDPPGDDFKPVRDAARHLHRLLQQMDLASFLMTTGSQGLHVVVPLDGTANFDPVRDFARDLAELLATRHPHKFTTETRKAQREGRIFLDYLRNAYGQTAVAPYAVRPLPGAPVATPLKWDELDDPDLHPQRYTITNIFRRLGQIEDPWTGLRQHGRSLQTARQKLSEIAA